MIFFPRAFTSDEFTSLFHAGLIVDGRSGGLVIGRSHGAGNIYMIQPDGDGGFLVNKHLEGGEYLVNYVAGIANQDQLEKINNDKRTHHILPEFIQPITRTINTSATPLDKLIFISYEGQFIINKYSTAKHIKDINAINESSVSKFKCDWRDHHA